jgi:MFS family permease
MPPAGRRIFAAKALRAFAFGWLSVILALALGERGLSPAAVGAVFTATMVEDALVTVALSLLATRIGAGRIMTLTALLLTVGGAVLAGARSPALLIVGAVLGTLSPNGQEAGPFLPLEQALLADAVPAASRTRVFGWYNVFGFLPAALGSLAAGGWLHLARVRGMEGAAAYGTMLWAYAAAGLGLAALYAGLPRARAARPATAPRAALSRSRSVVFQLAGLQAVDSLAGGFIIQSLLAYWFVTRFGVPAELLGPLFFGTNLLSAVSFLVAARVAERVGLLNTMVFTHLPSNVLLLLVPLMPTFPLAAAMLLGRHVLSQMDVPTRQAYTMALVTPEERPAAAGLTSSARALAQSLAPAVSGAVMKSAASGLPFLLAGGLKIVYDLSLYVRFRSVALDDADADADAR